MADFHHLDDARDIWLAVKARFGGNDESKKMRKSMLKQEFSEFRVSESEAKPDNEDCNMKFLKALPPSWSQVAITLKTKGGLDYLSFDDLYNKLRTLEIDVKGGSSYDSRGTYAPTHLAFISAASTNSKMSYPDQSHSTTFTSASSSPTLSSNVMENVLHSFVAERKQLDSKARYSSFKLKELDKTEEPKALLSVDSMLNWSDHEGEDVENGAAQVYGMIAGAEEDATGGATGSATGNATDDVADNVSTAADEFALMGISSQVKLRSPNSSNLTNGKTLKNLDKLINSSMSSRSKFGLGFGDTFGSDEVFDLSAPSIFDSSPKDGAEKPLYDSKSASVPAGSRNRPTYVPAGSRNRPTSVPAGRPFTAGWKNHAARHMTRPSNGKITGKGTIRTSKLNFENVYYVEELQNFNLFSVSQICDTKNKVLFTDKECLVLSKEFQPPENSQVVLRVPRRNNLYCFNLSDIKPERDVTCLLAKASLVCIKKIFKYLKGQPKLGLWYPRDSPFVLEAYNDSDYASSHGDRKSTTGGCQFLGRRLISWQCKNKPIVEYYSTEAE
ncbi:hypothetical protein Tco_0201222 [Tanacetum coccineum]